MENEFKGGPWLGGWLIAAAAGALTLGVTLVVGKFDYTPAVAMAGLVFLLVGIALTWLQSVPGSVSVPAMAPAPVMAPAVAAPVMAAVVKKEVAPSPATAKAAPAKPVAKAAVAKAPAKAAAPKSAPAKAAEPGKPRKPTALKAAKGGKADDLKIILGIGPKLEQLCHKLGFFHFDQLANWTAEEVSWVDENLEGFKGRVTRDRWVPQAKAIVELGPKEFLAQLAAGKTF